MPAILLKVRFAVKERLLRNLRRCRQAGLSLRSLIIIHLLNGRGCYQTAAVLGVHNATVYRLAQRFREQGEGACSTAGRTTAPPSWTSATWTPCTGSSAPAPNSTAGDGRPGPGNCWWRRWPARPASASTSPP